MSLNCLKCQSLKRVDSDKNFRESYNSSNEKPYFRLSCSMVERKWSENLASSPRACEKMGNEAAAALVAAKRVKKGRHRIHSTGSVEFPGTSPRLMRSCGMRRDWSFEELMQRIDMSR